MHTSRQNGIANARYNGSRRAENGRMGLPKTILTEDEYLAFERAAEERHIYVDGEIFAMAGETGEHSDIVTNTAVTLANQLGDGPCRVRIKDTKVRSGPLPKSPRRPAGLYSYPDIVVICDEPEYLDDFHDVVLNPKVIVETLSESTEAFDRGDKLRRYHKYNPSLTDYILIRQDRPQIEQFRRTRDGSWKYTIYEGMRAVVKIDSIRCRLRAADVYKRVKFAAQAGNEGSR
jgi:Uma2 family endonuclease